MAVSNGLTYAAGAPGTGWRKLDIMERILEQDPRAVPFFEMSGESEARSTKHEWQVRGVPVRASVAVSDGARLEGRSLVGQEIDIPTRVYNNCEIFHTGVEVSRSHQREQHYGTNDIWQEQIDHFSYVHVSAIEYKLIQGARVDGSAAQARQMTGLISSVSTNATDVAGIAFTESVFLDGLQTSWDNVDAPMLDCMVNRSLKRGIDQFASVGAVRNMEVRTRDVVHTVTKYFSSFAEVDIHLSRDMNDNGSVITPAQANNDIVWFDRRQMSKAYLDRTHLQPVAKTEDADTLVIISELTLRYGNEKSSVLYTDINVTL